MRNLAQELTEFERCPPVELEGDPIWRLPAYRIGAFLAEVARTDCALLRRFPPYIERANQLQAAVDAIPANITEGYGKISGKDRARFYEVALSSAREAREWYRRVRDPVGHEEALGRALLLTRIIKILTVAIPEERAGASEERIRRALERTRQHPEIRDSRKRQRGTDCPDNTPHAPSDEPL
jgi:four helix bundle protein